MSLSFRVGALLNEWGLGGRRERAPEPLAAERAVERVLAASAQRVPEPAPAPLPYPPAVEPLPGGRLRVLLAEDHPVNRKVVELILGGMAVDLTSVENGAEALAAHAASRFDLVLMDMQMPVMDGLTAIREIRAREAAAGGSRMPILSLTANAMPEHVEASFAAGADDHLTKPVSAPALVATVERVTGRRL